MTTLYINRDEIVKDYERALTRRFEVKHAFALADKEQAMQATLAAAGVTQGSEVILPVLADYEVAQAIVKFGAAPVFCDVYPGTFIAQSEDMERKMTDKTSAFLTTSQWGGLGDFPFHQELAQKTNIPLVSFATTGLGSKSAAWDGMKADIQCFGTDAGSILNLGSGGVILTNSAVVADKVTSLGITPASHDLGQRGLDYMQQWETHAVARKDAVTAQWNGFYPTMMHMPMEAYPPYILRSNSYNLYFLYKKPQNGLSQTPDYDEKNPAFKRADDVMDFIEGTGLIPDYKDCKPKLLADFADMAAIHKARSSKPPKEEFEHAHNTLRDIVVIPVLPDVPEETWAQLDELLYYTIVPGTYIPAPNFTAMLASNRKNGTQKPPRWDFVPDWFKQGKLSPS